MPKTGATPPTPFFFLINDLITKYKSSVLCFVYKATYIHSAYAS